MPQTLCVDANLVIAVLHPYEYLPAADAAWKQWSADAATIIAPPLFFAETTSVLRNHVYRGRLTAREGESLFAAAHALNVTAVSPPDLHQRAWELAKRYNLPRAYDAQYLAVATTLGCELWTADGRLANAVPEPWVRLVR